MVVRVPVVLLVAAGLSVIATSWLGVGTLVTVSADSGSDGIDRNGAVTVYDSGDVVQAVGCGRPGKTGGWVIPGGVVLDGVGHAQIQACL